MRSAPRPTGSSAWLSLPWLLLALGCSDAAPTGGGGEGTASGGSALSTGGAPATGGMPSSGGAFSSGGGGGLATGGQGSGGTNPGTGGHGGDGDVFRPPFILGADITGTLRDEYWDATYRDEGVEKPLEQILQDHGFNYVRIDTFVDPSAPGGFAEADPLPFRNLDQTIVLAKRVKALGMGFLLDLHMSDTWTNPGAQGTPHAWQGFGIDALETAVHDYVKDAVTRLAAEGVRPDMVQIGNEITNGFLWDAGRIQNDDFGNFARLLKAGIRAVRDVDDRIQVMLHIEKCNDLATTRWWLDGVLGQGVEFDVFGQSCYAPDGDRHPGYQGTPAEWATTFAALVDEYPDLDFVIAEYSAEQRAANDVMFQLPNGRGLGTFNWDPTRFYETHPNVPLFTTDGEWNDFVTIPERIGLYDQMAQDYGLRP